MFHLMTSSFIDNIEQSSNVQPMFAMSGDSHSEDVKIPSVFLFQKDGDIMRNHAKDYINTHNLRLNVRLAGTLDQASESFIYARSVSPSPLCSVYFVSFCRPTCIPILYAYCVCIFCLCILSSLFVFKKGIGTFSLFLHTCFKFLYTLIFASN